jgi:membrane-bound lytic murein transglycosylase D
LVRLSDAVWGEVGAPALSESSVSDGASEVAESLTVWLRGFGEVDLDQASEILGQIQRRFHGEYEVDLGPAKGTARMLAAVLSGAEETAAYAVWLQDRTRAWPNQVQFRVGSHGELARVAPPTSPLRVVKAIPALVEPRGAEHFVPKLKPIFESMDVPVELVWVAEVESAFDPRAVSPVGAAGLYQLMPATARQYGLVLEPEDDRFIPEKNARAAARHMLYLRRVFDDWHLAMAAYNAGHNRVRGLLAKHNARSFEEIAPYLPLETRMFVPKVDATLVRREGVSLARLGSRLP